MTDEELAAELITRLNRLCEDPAVREDIGKLINVRVPCSEATAAHPSIQVQTDDGTTAKTLLGWLGIPATLKNVVSQGPHVGFLGILNGLVGTIPDEPMAGWGHIAAVFTDDGKLTHFRSPIGSTT
jgi:hypothetical protein